MLSHVHIIRTACLFFIVCLVACQSPREESQALAAEVLEVLPVPTGEELIYSAEFERVSNTGMGTNYGVRALYGSNEEYTLVVARYRETLSAQGWDEYGLSVAGNPLFCNSDYDGVRLSPTNIDDFEDAVFAIPTGIISQSRSAYRTLYVLTIAHFPFDEVGTCE